MSRWEGMCFVDRACVRPTPSIMYVPSQVNRFKKIILLIVRYKYLKSCSRRFYCPNLVLRTRLCGTMFITQPSCLFDFHLTESVRRKWFVLAVYQFWKGISAGPALKYFTWFIGAGGLLRRHVFRSEGMCLVEKAGISLRGQVSRLEAGV